MTRPHPLPGNDPSHLPEIRDWIVESLQPGHPLRNGMDAVAYAYRQMGKTFGTTSDVELQGMATAKLFWVPKHEQDIIVNAKQTMPDDLTLQEEDVPYPSGFAVFEESFSGIDAETGVVMPHEVRALRWSPINVLTMDDEPIGQAMSMSSWTYDGRWYSMGRFDWLYGQPWREYFADFGATVDNLRSLWEDRARFMALWALMNTQDPPVYRPTRAELRRDARLAPRTEDRLVHVVKWDPRRYVVDNPVESTGRKVHVRFPVKDFWRRQPYGPGMSKRKWKYIPPHWRGPIDAPIKEHATTVYKVTEQKESH